MQQLYKCKNINSLCTADAANTLVQLTIWKIWFIIVPPVNSNEASFKQTSRSTVVERWCLHAWKFFRNACAFIYIVGHKGQGWTHAALFSSAKPILDQQCFIRPFFFQTACLFSLALKKLTKTQSLKKKLCFQFIPIFKGHHRSTPKTDTVFRHRYLSHCSHDHRGQEFNWTF